MGNDALRIPLPGWLEQAGKLLRTLGQGKRVDELGTKEPSIEQQGEDRIVVQVPGLSDPSHLLSILQTTAKMTFQMVDVTNDVQAAITSHRIPPNSELLEHERSRNDPPGSPPLFR